MSIFSCKSIESVKSQNKGGLSKTLGLKDLFLMGVGAIVGTGVFVLTGLVASQNAGPAVPLSYIIAGFAAIFIALVYTEVASMIPTSGGAYAYSYVALGEFWAWIVACLAVTYLVSSAATVAIAWSSYAMGVLKEFGFMLDPKFHTSFLEQGYGNLPAFFIAMVMVSLLIKGTKESTKINNLLVYTKFGAIVLFLILAIPAFDIGFWHSPDEVVETGHFMADNYMPNGLSGLLSGAGVLFFAYNGFDTLACAAEESKNPKRDLTIAIIGSLLVAMIIYVIVSAVLVGVTPHNELNSPNALVHALKDSRQGSLVIAMGVVLGMTTVIFMQIFALSRLVYSISRDGLFPKFLGKLNMKIHSPNNALVFFGLIIAVLSSFAPINVLASLASASSLSMYIFVALVAVILRFKEAGAERPFRCPAIWFVAPMAVILCGVLIHSVREQITPMVFIIALSFVFYFIYSRKNSVLNLKK